MEERSTLVTVSSRPSNYIYCTTQLGKGTNEIATIHPEVGPMLHNQDLEDRPFSRLLSLSPVGFRSSFGSQTSSTPSAQSLYSTSRSRTFLLAGSWR